MNGLDTLRRGLAPAIALFLLTLGAVHAQSLRQPARVAAFVENRGQWTGPGRFLARYGNLDMWVTNDALVYDFHRDADGARRGHVVRMEFVGADGAVVAPLGRPIAERHAYIERGARATEARLFDRVMLRNVARGVDVVTYNDGGFPRYDLHLEPGVDPSSIRLRFHGADGLSIGANGGLVIGTSLGLVEQRELVAYQMIGGARVPVDCRFIVARGNEVSFALGRHDARYPLVIDPLTYSTFVGGVNDDIANGVAADSNGNAYIVGETSSPDYPYTSGAYYATMRGGTDAFVTKISPDGTRVLFSTFIGGTDLDGALDVAVSRNGNVYVAGYTSSADFPARFGYDSTYNGAFDAFVLRLDSTGSRLTFSTVIGGSADDRATAIAVDSIGQVYVGGQTLSSSFPTTAGAYQVTAGGAEAFALRLTPNGRALVYSTFIGGDASEDVTDLAIRHGIAYVVGISESDGTTGDPFPTSTGAMQSAFGGQIDGFVTAVDTNGRGVLYSTLIGAAGDDIARAIAVDNIGAAHITGSTRSSAFPTTGGALQNVINGVQDAFVAKIGPDGGALNFSTFIGGGSIESGEAISVTSTGLTIIAGNTRSDGFPTTINALQQARAGDQDMFVAELGPFAYTLVYGSFLGGTGNDSMRSAAIVGATTLYLTGGTRSTDYPTTIGAAYRINAGGQDAFATRFDILQVTSPNTRTTLCAGDTHMISWSGGSSVNYDIAVSANNGQTWTPIAFGVSGNTYMWAIPAQQPAGSTYRIRVMVSGGSEADANDSTFTIIARPVVQTNPSSITRAERSTVTFSARGTGTQPVFWQRSTDNGLTWEDIPASSNDQLTVVSITAEDDSTLYRALYSNQCDTVATQPARLTVQSVRMVAPSGGEVFCLGTTQTIRFTRQHVDAVNVELSTNGGTNWSTIATNVTVDSLLWTIPTSLRPGGDFRIRVVHSNGSANDASDASFAIHSEPGVVQSPTSATADAGTSARFTVVGDAFPRFTIQWQSRAPGSSDWTDVPNATVGTLVISQTTVEQSGTQYRAVLTNACGSDTSEPATLTVNPSAGISTGDGATIGLAVRPNPASDRAEILFTAQRAAHAHMVVIDARGNTVRTLLDRRVDAGVGRVGVDTRSLASGAYRVVLRVDGVTYTSAFTVVR